MNVRLKHLPTWLNGYSVNSRLEFDVKMHQSRIIYQVWIVYSGADGNQMPLCFNAPKSYFAESAVVISMLPDA